MRCGGAGLGGVLTPTGVGTSVEEGKQKLVIDGKEYLLELPLHADVALVKATKADTAGNLYFRMNSRQGEKRYVCPMWKKARARAEAKAQERQERG